MGTVKGRMIDGYMFSRKGEDGRFQKFVAGQDYDFTEAEVTNFKVTVPDMFQFDLPVEPEPEPEPATK